MDRPSPSASSSVGRSLNLPKQSTPPVPSALHSYSQHPVPSALDAYSQHPEVATLDQIMLQYLEMEEILKLYRHNYEPFETRQTLNTLALRFQLPTATTFKQLLKSYDMQYATVRSYLYNNRSPKQILYQAALEGEIQAMYNQLKLYPKLRAKHVYDETLYKAAAGGHRAIMDLLLELGADSSRILQGAVKGGQLALVKEEVAKVGKKRIKVSRLANLAALNNRMQVLTYLLSLNPSLYTLNSALEGAGGNGSMELIEYLIAKGANNYFMLVEAAAERDQLEVFKKYYHKVNRANFVELFKVAVEERSFSIINYLLDEEGVAEARNIKKTLRKLKLDHTYYLRELKRPDKYSPNILKQLAKLREETLVMLQYLELQILKSQGGVTP